MVLLTFIVLIIDGTNAERARGRCCVLCAVARSSRRLIRPPTAIRMWSTGAWAVDWTLESAATVYY